MDRRRFLQTATATTLMASLGKKIGRAASTDIPQRILGRTGEKVSIVGLGGFHLGMQSDEQESIRIIRRGLDHGINFLDNCWDYTPGRAKFAWARRCATAIARRHSS